MYNAEGLIEIHNRGHESLKKILEHCRQFSVEELNRNIKGFGYQSLSLQLHHIIGAEKYWIGVLEGRIDVDDDITQYDTIEKQAKYRQRAVSIRMRQIHSFFKLPFFPHSAC